MVDLTMVDNGFERSLGGIAPRVPAASQRRCDVTRALGLSNTEMRKDGEVTPTPTMGSYYDIDAILTDAQKVPCTFELEVPGLGYIDDNAGADVSTASTMRRRLMRSPPPYLLARLHTRHLR